MRAVDCLGGKPFRAITLLQLAPAWIREND